MARSLISFMLFSLVVIAAFAGKSMEANDAGCDHLDAIGGGCPDMKACGDTCKPCYRGVGVVQFQCIAPGGGIIWWICRCWFTKGAPCPPSGPPTCPAPGQPPQPHREIGGAGDDRRPNGTADKMQFP